jgi:hypothetical protein
MNGAHEAEFEKQIELGRKSAVNRVINRALKAFDETSTSTDQDMLMDLEVKGEEVSKRKVLKGKF